MTIFLFIMLLTLPSTLWAEADNTLLQESPQSQAEINTGEDPLTENSEEPLSSDSKVEFNPLTLLGLLPERIVELLGAPSEVFSYRGPTAGEDNVVFYYPSHIYLFFFKNRVWQIRADHRYEKPVLGINMGGTLEEVENRFGTPFAEVEDSRIYLLPYQHYPVRARLFFKERILQDLYIYRSDY